MFGSRKDDHKECCGGCKELLQEAVNHLRTINQNTSLIGSQGGVVQQLSALNDSSRQILKQETKIAMTVPEIQVKVAEQTTVIQSGIVLMGQLSDLIRTNANDPAALQQIADSIDGTKQSMADAIVANTPAAA